MQTIIAWPESQNLFELQGFKENCRLVNGERGIEEYGSSAYLTDTDWLNRAKPATQEEEGEIDQVFDDELEELNLL